MQFSTYDRDNDRRPNGHCAIKCTGAWWYNSCVKSNLNGQYGPTEYCRGVVWKTWKGPDMSMQQVKMMIRKK